MKTITTALIAAASLSIAACGSSSTTENTLVANEVVLDEGTDNFTAIDSLNTSDTTLGNAAAPTDAALDAGNAIDTGNVTNATE